MVSPCQILSRRKGGRLDDSSPCANVKISIVSMLCVCFANFSMLCVCVLRISLCCGLGMLCTDLVCMLRQTCGQFLRSEPRNNVSKPVGYCNV
jgi:hypothetical protein